MAAWDERIFQRILPKVREAQLTITTNVLTNLIKQGRTDPPPVRGGIPRLVDLINAGVNVTCAIEDMKNMFYPFGTMNPLDVVYIETHAGYLTTKDLLQSAFEMPLYNGARLFHIEDYGIMEGNTANLLVLSVNSIVDAIRFHPPPALVMREGKVLVQSEFHRVIDSSVPI